MELTLKDANGALEVSEATFGREFNEALVHQVVVAYSAGARQGSKAQKTRSEVRGGGKKPWRQKGTGRARAGSNRRTQDRGGQTVFGPVVRSHATELPKKVRALALKCALSSKAAEGKLIVLDEAKSKDHKTKAMATAMQALGLESALIIAGNEVDVNFARATANLPRIDVLTSNGTNVYDIMRRDTLVLTKEAVESLTERLAS